MTQDHLADRIRALEHVPMFRKLDREVLEVLAARTKRRRFPGGEPIVHEGEAGTTLFIVTGGLVKIAINTPSGNEMVLALLNENQFFGEMAILDGQPRSATAVALEPSDLVVLTRQEFIACLKVYPEVAIGLLAELSGRLRRTNRMLSDIATHSLQLRLIHKLLDLADAFGSPHESGGVSISVRLRQQDVAEMVNASREQVNRSLRAMAHEGLVLLEHQKITLLQPEELRNRLIAAS